MKNHVDDIVIHPIMTKKEQALPAAGLILVNPADARYGMDIFETQGATRRPLHNSNLFVSEREDFFVAGPAIGAPVAVMVMEKLIALGARHIYFYGWCGAIAPDLSVCDLVVPTQAISGEGTSHYYIKSGEQPGPSRETSKDLAMVMEKNGFPVKDGYLWTTDAPYRESRSYLNTLYKEHKVTAVDMEFSALCSVAAFRNIDFAALMIVSDEIWAEKWSTGFSKKEFRKKTRALIDILLEEQELRESLV